MMDVPLLIKQLLWRAERVFGDKEVVTRSDGDYHRYDYAELALRARKLSEALASIGVGPSERVGTLAWNTNQHYEAYFGVPCMGAVLHTINPRLFPDQIAHVINHAGDKVIMFDADQRELVEQVAPRLTTVEHYLALGSEPAAPSSVLGSLYSYEELLAAAGGDLSWPDLDEHAAAAMCYTSATTGEPKGVVYSHRSVVLHALNLAVHGSIGVREDSTFLAISPMFHANSWGIPYAAAMEGAKLVLPGLHPRPADYLEAIERERVTHAVGAVSVGVMMREVLENALMAHPGVVEATVVAVPDQRWLERPLACVVTRGATSAEELSAYLAERFARWWVSDQYVFLQDIPKTGVGKFDKKLLRSRYADPAARQAASAVTAGQEPAR